MSGTNRTGKPASAMRGNNEPAPAMSLLITMTVTLIAAGILWGAFSDVPKLHHPAPPAMLEGEM